MKLRKSYFLSLVIGLAVYLSICNAQDCTLKLSNPKQIAHSITVDKSGRGDFTSLQSAVDSVPENNNQWIHIKISAGTYTEKVTVSVKKPCLFFEGVGRNSTSIEWGDHEASSNSATVSFYAENILVKGIAFKNTYDFGVRPLPPPQWKQAVSARVGSDKVAFYDCAFYGIQDTLWDENGRHYFNNCYIEGSVDFVFGSARSIYEKCQLFVNIGRYVTEPGLGGWITAQNKERPQDTGAFVFKYCYVNGVGKTRLGRAWGPYATVIFANTYMSNVVSPEGWDAWDYKGHESNFTYAEANNKGPGSDTSKRVPWLKKLDASQLKRFLDISYIDEDGWIEKLPL